MAPLTEFVIGTKMMLRGFPSSFRPPTRHSGESRNPGVALITPNHSHQSAPRFSYLGVPAAAGMGDWYENGVTRPQVCLNAAGPRFVIPAKAGIQRGGVAPMTPKHFQRPSLIFIPWCAGGNRHGRMVRKHVPLSEQRWPAPATPARISCRADSRIGQGGVVMPARPERI